MKEWLKKIELFVDKFIPYLLVLLIFVIIIELFFHDVAEAYRYHINLLDGFIVLVFLLDLYNKYLIIIPIAYSDLFGHPIRFYPDSKILINNS